VFPRRLAGRLLASHLAVVLAAIAFTGFSLGGFGAGAAVLAVALTGIAIGFAFGLTRSVTRPIDRLTGIVRRFARGDLPEASASGAAASPTVPDVLELADLAASLDRMAAELRARIDEAEGERDRAGQVLGALENGVLLVDADGGLQFANDAARHWLGLGNFPPGTRVQRALGALEVTGLAERAAEAGEPVDGELALIYPERRSLSMRATPLTERGEAAGVVVTLVDQTSRRRLDTLRRDFVANASHELKTPVAAIKALAEGMEVASDDPETLRRFMLRIQGEAERLERLVSDLLDLSRVERGLFGSEPVELAALAKEVVARNEELATASGIELRGELEAGVGVKGDRAQLELLLSNLIGNALQYTEAGGTVDVLVRGKDQLAEIVVRDTGIGIPQSELPRVFERFYRIDKARTRATGGTGLGLAIVRHVAETHGGRVSVRSELNRGSTFTVTLPRRES
jgi:two-component system phosphate regulon sensor histidine kinase PhoR